MTEITFNALLQEALTKPGTLSAAYRAFHNYSLGNIMAACIQLSARGQEPCPIASFMAWKEKGRSVKKGAKAIALCMPITCKGRRTSKETGDDEQYSFGRFIWKNNWFVLSDTEGEAFAPATKSPMWNCAQALDVLGIRETPFTYHDGNKQGYAIGNTIAINPVAGCPEKTRFHEMAHVVLGHTKIEAMFDDDRPEQHIREAEAESVAYILCSLLCLPGTDTARAFVQSWLRGAELPELNAQRIFKAANQIMKAGQLIEIADESQV